MTKIERALFAVMLALLAAGVTLVMVKAKVETNPATQIESPDCATCHPSFQEAWAAGVHGHALSDPSFGAAWSAQGQPGACLVCHVTGYDPATGTWEQDGVACQACHSPVNMNHPNEPMPINEPADLCGHCHSDVRFGWQEWQSSTHFQRNMQCTVCHDPHSASIKVVEGMAAQGASALCINCHRQYSMEFPYSNHNQAGVNCVDCHLRHYGESGDRDAHTMPDHSFNANLESCTACHAEQMHTASESTLEAGTQIPSPTNTPLSDDDAVMGQPTPLSPYGFAGLAGLLGLAGGMVLSPWLDRAYRHLSQARRK